MVWRRPAVGRARVDDADSRGATVPGAAPRDALPDDPETRADPFSVRRLERSLAVLGGGSGFSSTPSLCASSGTGDGPYTIKSRVSVACRPRRVLYVVADRDPITLNSPVTRRDEAVVAGDAAADLGSVRTKDCDSDAWL